MNGIKLAGFGLGLAVTAVSLVGLSLVLPVTTGPQTPTSVIGAADIDAPATPEVNAPVTTPSLLGAPVPDLLPPSEELVQAPTPSLPLAAEPASAEPLADTGVADTVEAPAEAAVEENMIGMTAPQPPLAVVPDIIAPPATLGRNDDTAGLAISTLPAPNPVPLAQTPFSPPTLDRDGLPAAPDLPVRAPVTPPQPDPVIPEVDTAQPVLPDTAAPAAPSPAADPVPDAPSVAISRPAPDATAPALPGRPVPGMPGQSPSRADGIEAALTPSADDAPMTALARNAAVFDLNASGPLMAVVLNDPGLPTSARAELAALDLPFSVALNPMDPTASQAALLYRDAGKEVFLIAAGLPDGATASDVDVTLSAYFSALPMSAGLIDLPRDGVVRNARLLGDVLQVVARDGHGFITFAGGLGQAARVAAAAGVAHTEVFRVLDPSDESPFTIRRFLDRAVFQAAQLGQVVVFGEASNDAMLQALDLWMTEGRADQVTLVPASAILLGAQTLAP